MRTILALAIAAILLIAPQALAWTQDGQYHYECLHKGESMRDYYCDHTLCTFCQKDGYTTDPGYCKGQTLQCSGGGGAIDVTPPVITLSSPHEGDVFGVRVVPFSISTNEQSGYYYRNNINPRGWVRICSSCTSYTRELSFNDGFQNVTIMASDSGGNNAYRDVTFTVDSQKPVIKGVTPRDSMYTNGDFTITYDEIDLMKITLNWQSSGIWHIVSKTDCLKGMGQTCVFTVPNLPDGELTYYFIVEDRANSVQSSQVKVTVDKVGPVLTVNKPQAIAYGSSVPVELTVSEPVILSYQEQGATSWTTLCSNCQGITKSITLSDGSHTLIFKAIDGAGSKDEESISLTVDSKPPKIVSTSPSANSYVNGVFTVVYDEANHVEVTLHYNQSSLKEVIKTDCLSGTGQACTFDLPAMGKILEQGNLKYWFTVKDAATTVNSKMVAVKVDTVTPQITATQPTAMAYASRSVPFTLASNEPVTFQYYDHSDSRARWKPLCSGCLSYDRKQSLKDGTHDLEIRATDPAGNAKSVMVTLQVDSKAPRIRSMTPANNGYANGVFSVLLQEPNLQWVKLHYNYEGQAEQTATVLAGECVDEDSYKRCTAVVALPAQGTLYYWFEVKDIATSVMSRTSKVMVDTVAPVLTLSSPLAGTYPAGYLLLNMSSTERAKLEYYDSAATRPMWVRLCSSCVSYSRTRSFATGTHTLTFRATDPAGNTDEITRSIIVS